LPADLHEHFPAAWAVEFAEENPLPRAQRQLAALYQDLLTAADNGAFAVGVGIAFKMSVPRSMMGYEFGKRQKYIVRDGRVSVFVYGNSRRRMWAVDYRIAVGYTRLTYNRPDFTCYVNRLVALLAAHAKIFCNDFHYHFLTSARRLRCPGAHLIRV